MLVEALLKTPDSVLYRTLASDDWSLTDHLLALVHDQLAVANWQRSGKKNAPRPKPISPLAKRGTRYGKTTQGSDEVKAFLARLNPNQYREVGDGGGSRQRMGIDPAVDARVLEAAPS